MWLPDERATRQIYMEDKNDLPKTQNERRHTVGQLNLEIALQHQPQAAETPVLANQESEFGQFEPYVDEDVVSRFISFTPRCVLEMARNGEIPAHPRGRGVRKRWRFLISEIDAHFRQKKQPVHATMTRAVPRASKRRIA